MKNWRAKKNAPFHYEYELYTRTGIKNAAVVPTTHDMWFDWPTCNTQTKQSIDYIINHRFNHKTSMFLYI